MNSTSRALWNLMAGQRRRYLAACVALAGATLLTYAAPLLIRAAIDGVIDPAGATGGNLSGPADLFRRLQESAGIGKSLLIAALALVAMTAAGGALNYVRGRLSARSTENIIKSLRLRLYDHLQHVTMAWHDKAQTGDIVQRCTSDVETLRAFYSNQVIEIVQNALRVLIVVPILVMLDWKMAIAATGLMPVIIGFAVFFFSRVQGKFKKSDECEGAMTAALQENLTGIRVVRAFARQAFETERFRVKNDDNREAAWRLMKLLAVYWSSSDCLCFLQSGLLLFVGVSRVHSGVMSVGTLVAFVTYAQMFIWPLREVGRVLTELGKALVSVGRIRELLDVPREPAPVEPVALPTERVRGEIDIRDVHFGYGESDALRGVTLQIPAGSTVALLGPSGSGKTTLINLLLRMYDGARGTITLDGVDITRIDRAFIRSQFGVVFQEPFLFSKTLAENMRLGRHDAADEEMQTAARVAAVHETVESFPQGYATVIGERGVTLSGGQRQRTAIARALLRDAPILILDDALSAVDTHTESAILQALRARRESEAPRTTILIAHRLSTLRHADLIAVMEQGRIVQLGTHDELVKQEGLYRRLWEIQTVLEEDLKSELENETMIPANLTPVT